MTNTKSPACKSSVKKECRMVPGIKKVRLYVSIRVAPVSAPPTPRKIPAIGNMAIGSIKALPIFCSNENTEFMSSLLS